MSMIRRMMDTVKDTRRRVLSRQVPIESLLLGPDVAGDPWEYGEKTGDWLRTSTRLSDGPHIALLRDAARGAMSDDVLRNSAYVRQGMRCIAAFGRFHEATDEASMVRLAKAFIAAHADGRGSLAAGAPGRSREGSLPVIRRVWGSDMFQVLDGHHRLASVAAGGATTARVYLKSKPAYTSAQRLILEVESTRHRPALYQPVELPEMGEGWPLRRRCIDRMEMMRGFLEARGMLGPRADGSARTSLDVACNYGWFVAKYRALGFRSHGVEIDPAALKVGRVLYGNSDQDVTCRDGVEFLRAVNAPYDVVTCFSLAHHFVLGRGPCSAEELMRLLDKACHGVMFFDTGQDHERWFREKLKGWNEAKVESWLRETTTFREIVRLGVDKDDVGVTAENYRRMLFALVR